MANLGYMGNNDDVIWVEVSATTVETRDHCRKGVLSHGGPSNMRKGSTARVAKGSFVAETQLAGVWWRVLCGYQHAGPVHIGNWDRGDVDLLPQE